MPRPTVSVFLLASNEADRIQRCLDSLTWADEVVVVVNTDSADATADLCRTAGARVFEHAWEGYARQCQFALEQCTGDWILRIDADEVVSPALAAAIREMDPDTPCVGMRIPRRNIFWGRTLRCQYPDRQLRLYRKGKGDFPPREVHETWCPTDPHAPVGRLHGDIIHYSYRSYTHFMAKMVSYAELGAREIVKTRRVTSLAPAVCNALVCFIKYQFLKGGIRDGIPGLAFNATLAFYTFYKYVKAYELTKEGEREKVGV
jgi:glycosyltransferase involved in cell wall biosynthesis